ncbi:hypothetical protein ABE10_01360, partial [Bacillus toyonensis]|nr:hypothetical protein [Bacillus toyonensis]
PRLPEKAIGEVPKHAAEQSAEDDGPQPRTDRQRLPHDDAGHHGQRDREDPRHVLAERERRPRVSDEDQLQELSEDRHGLTGRQILDREVLDELVGGQRERC